jgi:two-component sensor histidine kinase
MEMLVAELQHRTRNLLTVVRSLAAQTLKNSTSPDNDEHRPMLEWLEEGGGPLSRGHEGTSDCHGYGRELIERALPHAPGAEIHLTFSETGVSCLIDLLLDRTGKQEAR